MIPKFSLYNTFIPTPDFPLLYFVRCKSGVAFVRRRSCNVSLVCVSIFYTQLIFAFSYFSFMVVSFYFYNSLLMSCCMPCLTEFEPYHEKTNVLVSDRVLHKSGCTATEDGYRLEILYLESRGIVLSM